MLFLVYFQVINGVRMWTEMSRAGVHLQAALYSTYTSKGGEGKITWTRFDPVEDEQDMEDGPTTNHPFYYIGL